MKNGDTLFFDRYEWQVLEKQKEKILIITKNIVDQRCYNDSKADFTWSSSTMRHYLNGEFYDNFSQKNKEFIIPVNNINPRNPWYGINDDEDTVDSIFLLSIDEVVRTYFGDSSMNLENRSSKQRYWFQKKDINNENRRAVTNDSNPWWWWLRTAGRDRNRAAYVHGDGNIGIQGNGTYQYNSKIIHPVTKKNYGGVRPAMWIKPF